MAKLPQNHLTFSEEKGSQKWLVFSFLTKIKQFNFQYSSKKNISSRKQRLIFIFTKKNQPTLIKNVKNSYGR